MSRNIFWGVGMNWRFWLGFRSKLGISSLLFVLGSLSGCSTFSAQSQVDSLTSLSPAKASVDLASISEESFMVPGGDPGISLYIRNKRLKTLGSYRPDNVVLFVHGATYPSETGFDLRLDGVSWMDVLAAAGFDVYMVDIRGYGPSTRPPEMSQPASQNPPIVNSDVAARDYAAAADWVRSRRSIPRLIVMGHSWGTVISSVYTTRHPDKVQRLVLYAPVWLRQTPSLTDAGGSLGAYRQVTVAQAKARKDAGLRPGVQLQSDAWFEIWSRETFSSDPVGRLADPKFVRAPNGVVEEGRNTWNKGTPVYDPALIKVPTLLVLAEWDADTPPYMAQTLFTLLTNSHPKKLTILSQGTHGIMNETNRFALFDEVQRFLMDGRTN